MPCELLLCKLNLLPFVEGKAGMFLILLQKPAVVDLIHSTTKFYLPHARRVVSGGDDRCYQQ